MSTSIAPYVCWGDIDYEKDLKSEQGIASQKANWITSGVSIAYSLVYMVGCLKALWRLWRLRRARVVVKVEGREEKPEGDARRTDLNCTFLSGVLASLVAVLVIYTKWPQTLCQACLVVMSLAQACAIGFSDFTYESKAMEILMAKTLDAASVALSIYAIKDAQDVWLAKHERPSVRPFAMDDPASWAEYVSIGYVASSAFGFALYYLPTSGKLPLASVNRRWVTSMTILPCMARCGASGVALYCGYRFGSNSCWPFAVGYWAVAAAICCGTAFDIAQCALRIIENR